MVTLEDIARKTGFSRSVVSRSMNPHSDQRVAAKTRMLIEAASRELGYKPNHAASLLARGSSTSIGLFLPPVLGEMISHLITGLSEIANAHGFSYNLYFGFNDNDYQEFIRHSREIQSAGIITYLPSSQNSKLLPLFRQLSDNSCQIVLLNCAGLQLPGVQTVSIDNEFGGREAARRLFETRCDRFLSSCRSLSNSWQMKERLRGFADYLAAHGATAEVSTVRMARNYQIDDPDFIHKVIELARGKTQTGIFMTTDYEALSLYHILGRENLLGRVGKTLRIIGFDDLIIDNMIEPGLTSFAQPFRELGQISMSLLLNAMIKANLNVDMEQLKPKLVVRASG